MGEGITCSLHSLIQNQSQAMQFHKRHCHYQDFCKGIKNAHSLATHIYEKGPQTLMDTILEVEKLNAIQQLTSTIIPPSTVDVMSNEEDCCFQFQEPEHIA